MEIRQLYYVLETAKYKSFTKAAEALFTTQPNISKQIGLLEEELNTKLFFRSHHSVILTRDGERFCMHAKKVIDDIDALLMDFSNGQTEQKARLTIGVFPFFARMEMSSELRDFFGQNENIIGSVRPMDNYEAYRALDSGEIDFAIIKLRPEDRLRHFRYHQLVTENLLVLIHRSHELASKEVLSTADLEKYDFSPGDGFMTLYSGHSLHTMISSADFMMQMISELKGFTFITESAGATVNNPDVKLIPLETPIE